VIFPNRYEVPLVEAFQYLTGIEVPKPKSRQSSVGSGGVIYRFPRGRNIPWLTAVAAKQSGGLPTIGVTGSEWAGEYAESVRNNFSLPRLDSFRITDKKLGELALFTPPNIDSVEVAERFANKAEVGVVTPYPRLTTAMAARWGWGVRPDLIFDDAEETVNGGVEAVAEMFGLPGVDLVCSSQTLVVNECTYVAKLGDVYPVLVAPRSMRGSRDENL
jgi:hypothetical protein